MFDKTLPVRAAADLFMRSRAFSRLRFCIKSRFSSDGLRVSALCLRTGGTPLHQKASPGLHFLFVCVCEPVFPAAVDVGGGETFHILIKDGVQMQKPTLDRMHM